MITFSSRPPQKVGMEGIVAPPTADGVIRDLPHPDGTFGGGAW